MVCEPPSVEPGSRVCVSACVRACSVSAHLCCAERASVSPEYLVSPGRLVAPQPASAGRSAAEQTQSKRRADCWTFSGLDVPPLSGWFEGSEQLEQKCLPCAECERGIKARVYTTARARRSGLRLRQ